MIHLHSKNTDRRAWRMKFDTVFRASLSISFYFGISLTDEWGLSLDGLLADLKSSSFSGPLLNAVNIFYVNNIFGNLLC